MALRRVTMQDIADACGLSRNTVSKIFNDRGAVPEATRRMVLEQAQALGYHQLPEKPAKTGQHPQNIALFTSHMPADYHFGTFFVPAFAGHLSRAGYTLMMVELSAEELRLGRLPAQVAPAQLAGILGIELFNRDYTQMLCSLGLPTIFVDAHTGACTDLLDYDLILMENFSSTIALTRHMIGAGARRLGFVGDADHCSSFHERWTGFTTALSEAGLPVERGLCILDRDGPQYSDPVWIRGRLQRMPLLPDAIVCANDSIALCLMTALKQLDVAIPDRVMVAGFDGTPQSAVVEPSLTTVRIPSDDIGRLAADILLDRIENPGRPYRTTYVRTVPLLRHSTARS